MFEIGRNDFRWIADCRIIKCTGFAEKGVNFILWLKQFEDIFIIMTAVESNQSSHVANLRWDIFQSEWEYSAVIEEYGRFPEHIVFPEQCKFHHKRRQFCYHRCYCCCCFTLSLRQFCMFASSYRSLSFIERSECDILT